MSIGSKIVASATALLICTAGASASYSEMCFSLRATAVIAGETHTAIFEVPSSEMYYDEASGGNAWSLQSPFELRSASGALLGVLSTGSVLVIDDPVVSVNFSVSAGAVQTAFDISSTQLGFVGLVGATGSASASLTANDDSGNGIVTVAAVGAFPSSTLYVARYNNTGPLDGSDLGGAGLLAGGSHPFIYGTAGNIPSQLIPGSVSNMQAGFQFTLSEGDQAAGTSTFTIVPAPGAAGLLGLAGLLVARRRR